MRSALSYQSRRELVQQMAPRYQKASRAHKISMLDEFVAITGYARKYAIQLLNHPQEPKPRSQQTRLPHYGSEVQHALHLVWKAANQICAKRLIPFLPTLVEALERHGHLHLSEECRHQLLSISATTADRLLRASRPQGPHGLSTTRAGTLLKHQIPIRTFQDWNETQPGFLEADLVAHCGLQAEGGHLYTLTLTDIATGWRLSNAHARCSLFRSWVLIPIMVGSSSMRKCSGTANKDRLRLPEDGLIRKETSVLSNRKMERLCERLVGYDRFVGEYASSATHRTLPGTAPVCELFSAEGVAAVEATRGEKSALRLRPSQDSTATFAPLRRPACSETARTARGGTRARSHRPLPTTEAVAKGCLLLCCQCSTFDLKHPFCTRPRLFRGLLHDGKRPGFEERTRSSCRTQHSVPRAGEEKTHPGLAAYEDKTPL